MGEQGAAGSFDNTDAFVWSRSGDIVDIRISNSFAFKELGHNKDWIILEKIIIILDILILSLYIYMF